MGSVPNFYEQLTLCQEGKVLFAHEEVPFLGHIVDKGELHMDSAKIKAILEWEPPTKVIELRSFLSLVSYYRWFIKGYYAIATLSLTC